MGKKKATVAAKEREARIFIEPPNMKRAAFTVRGTSPLVMHQMSQKTRDILKKKMEQGSIKVAGKKTRTPRDFQKDFEGSMHMSSEGWIGLPVMALKNAMVYACRTTGDKMTHLKLAFWVESESFSKFGAGLTKIKGKPYMVIHPAPNQNRAWDLRSRAMFDPGWQAVVRLKYDADMISIESLGNLLMRAGLQVGILEGRNASKLSCGMGWGSFEVLDKKDLKDEAA